MKTNPNDPAGVGINRNEWGVASEGLTKREYFAATAMQGLLAKYGENDPRASASTAVLAADVLIAALNETSTSKQY